MKWLQSTKCFNDVAQYSDTLGKYRIVNRSHPDFPDKLDGSFGVLSGEFVAIFCDSLQLFVVISEQSFQLTDDLFLRVTGKNKRCLTVIENQKVLKKLEYSINNNSIEGDFTAFIDEEDEDYGLFLSNISKDKHRQRIFLGLE